MEVSVDLNLVEDFVTSKKFSDFLLENTTEFGTAAFILQSCLNAIEESKEFMEKET